jgi:predicted DNA binding protein
MPEGIHAVVEVCRPDACDVAGLSREVAVEGVTRAGTLSSDGHVTQEVTVETDGLDGDPSALDDADPVFEYDGNAVYRLERSHGQGCPCEVIERRDCPVRSMEVDGGTVRLAFIAADVGVVRGVVEDLRAAFGDVRVRRLTRSPPTDGDAELLLVDETAFTDRQREVLETAHRMGYFAYPKEANAGEVASELGVTTATFVEHLSAAQSKLFDAVLDA